MKKLLLGFVLLFTVSCGFNGNQKLSVRDSTHEFVQIGESFIYVVLRLEFISEIRELCEGLHPMEHYESDWERRMAVSECTFEKMSLIQIDFGRLDDFTSRYCDEDIDWSETDLTQEQIDDIQAACNLLNF